MQRRSRAGCSRSWRFTWSGGHQRLQTGQVVDRRVEQLELFRDPGRDACTELLRIEHLQADERVGNSLYVCHPVLRPDAFAGIA